MKWIDVVGTVGGQMLNGLEQLLPGFGFHNQLPGVFAIGLFRKGRAWPNDFDVRYLPT
jgi:hypothetical protein